MKILTVLLLLCLCLAEPLLATSLRVCTQNLNRLGSTTSEFFERAKQFSDIFAKANCSVIALQEIIASDQQSAEHLLEVMSDRMTQRAGEIFRYSLMFQQSSSLQLGFLFKQRLFFNVKSSIFPRLVLTRLSRFQRPRSFIRRPIILSADLRTADGVTKPIMFINFHLKSQRYFPPDPAGLRWEGYRMEMAEAVRTVALEKASERRDLIVFLLGDRNSVPESASALILQGRYLISDFQTGGPCVVLENLEPWCQTVAAREPAFRSLFEGQISRKIGGSYKYKGKWNWLDEILILGRNSRAQRRRFLSGKSHIIKIPQLVSDHSLLVSKIDL